MSSEVGQPFTFWAWTAIILFSAAVFATNIAIYPIVYYLFKEDLAVMNILLIITAELLLWFLMLTILYSTISSTTAMAKIREQNRIMEMKESQFRSQQKYIKASERTRHDFRHNIMTLTKLYEAGDLEAMGKFFRQYVESIPEKETTTFCSNIAIPWE